MKTIYGRAPYFKQGEKILEHDETADLLIAMGRATEEPEAKKAEKPPTTDKTDKQANKRETK